MYIYSLPIDFVQVGRIAERNSYNQSMGNNLVNQPHIYIIVAGGFHPTAWEAIVIAIQEFVCSFLTKCVIVLAGT